MLVVLFDEIILDFCEKISSALGTEEAEKCVLILIV